MKLLLIVLKEEFVHFFSSSSSFFRYLFIHFGRVCVYERCSSFAVFFSGSLFTVLFHHEVEEFFQAPQYECNKLISQTHESGSKMKWCFVIMQFVFDSKKREKMYNGTHKITSLRTANKSGLVARSFNELCFLSFFFRFIGFFPSSSSSLHFCRFCQAKFEIIIAKVKWTKWRYASKMSIQNYRIIHVQMGKCGNCGGAKMIIHFFFLLNSAPCLRQLHFR